MAPQIGDTVVYIQPSHEKPHNGHRDHPALVTYAWSADCLNLKVFFDCGPIEDRTSVNRYSTLHGSGFEEKVGRVLTATAKV